MSHPADDPRRNLLTGSDLAALDVPDERVREWLAAGSIEQVGTLPGDEGGEPVFAVYSPGLRRELEAGLGELGRTGVATAPLHARSQLLQMLLARSGDEAGIDGWPQAAGPGPDEEDHAVAVGAGADDVGREVGDGVGAALDAVRGAFDDVLAAAGARGEGGTVARADAPHEVLAVPDPATGDGGEQLEPGPRPEDPVREEPLPPAAGRSALEGLFDDHGYDPRVTAPAEHAPAVEMPAAAGDEETAALALGLSFGGPSPDAPAEALAAPLRQMDLTLASLAERIPPPVDLGPLIQAVEAGLESVREQCAQSPPLLLVAARLEQLQETLERALRTAHVSAAKGARRTARANEGPAGDGPAGAGAGRAAAMLAAVGLMLLGWVGVLWFETGDAHVALAALVAANLAGCLLLVGRRR